MLVLAVFDYYAGRWLTNDPLGITEAVVMAKESFSKFEAMAERRWKKCAALKCR